MTTKVQTGWIESRKTAIAYRRAGKGPRMVVLVHGLGDSAGCWNETFSNLSEVAEVIAVDLAGHGASSMGDDPPSVEMYAENVNDLLAQLDLRQPIFIGHSVGALAILLFVALNPDAAAGIVLEDPQLFYRNPPREFLELTVSLKQHSPSMLDSIARERFPSWSDSDIKSWIEASLAVDDHLLHFVANPRLVWADLLRRIICPGLLLVGDPRRHANYDKTDVYAMKNIIEQIKIVQFSKAGHNIRRDLSTEYLSAIRAFTDAVWTSQR